MNYGRNLTVHKKSLCDMDMRADNIYADNNFRHLELFEVTWHIRHFHDYFEAMTNTPVVRVVMAYMTDSGKSVILFY